MAAAHNSGFLARCMGFIPYLPTLVGEAPKTLTLLRPSTKIPTMKSHPTISLISSSLPSLDPNGQPYSMVLRGEAAELRELESALSSNHPHTRKQLLDEFQTVEADDAFADAEEEEEEEEHITQESITIN